MKRYEREARQFELETETKENGRMELKRSSEKLTGIPETVLMIEVEFLGRETGEDLV